MQVILGVIFRFIGGFASGSFYMPYKKVRQWNRKSYWIVGGLFSWLIVLPLAATFIVPGFWDIIKETPGSVIKYTLLFGVLWGFVEGIRPLPSIPLSVYHTNYIKGCYVI